MRLILTPKSIAAIIFLMLIIVFGVVETYILGQGNNFSQHIDLLNAIYFTIITISTVGYGDITPITPAAKVFVIILIILGLGAFLTTISLISGEIMDSRINKLTSKITSIEGRMTKNHVLLLGGGAINMAYIEKLKAKKEKYLIVVQNKEDVDVLISKGYHAVYGNLTSEENINKFNPKKAVTIIVNMRHKEDIIYTTLILSDIAKDVKTIVVVETDETESRLKSIMKIKEITIINPSKKIAEDLELMLK